MMTLDVEAPELPELFEAVAVQLTNALIEAESVGAALREKILLESPNPATLLQDWLNTLLELLRVQRMVFSDFHILEIKGAGPLTLLAEVTGELIDPHRHQFLKKVVGLSCRHVQLEKTYHAVVQFGY